jgi:hypothetical protein
MFMARTTTKVNAYRRSKGAFTVDPLAHTLRGRRLDAGSAANFGVADVEIGVAGI